MEAGLRAAGIDLKASKEPWKETDPNKWRGYVLGGWRRQQKKHEELRGLYDTKLILVEKMLSQWVAQHPDADLPVTFDNWFTQPDFCRFLDEELHLGYVGTLASTDKVNLKNGQLSVGDFAERLKQEHLAAVSHGHPPVFQRIRIPFKGEHEIYYSYCNIHRLHNFGRQRLVINYRQADLVDNPTFYISNRLSWHAPGITRIRRHRWPVDAKRITRKARPKGWTGISYGTSALFNDMLPWSPWSTHYCAPPNMTLLFTRSFTGSFTSMWKITRRLDVERRKPNPCGAWAC